MRPAEFCECYIMACLSLIFISNSALALLLGIPYSEQRRKRVLDLDNPIFGKGEVIQIITSSLIVVLAFCLFLCGTQAVSRGRFRVSKAIALILFAALSVLGACCLTTYGGRNEYCESNSSQNPKCYRRPDVDLPMTWFSTAIALTGVVASLVLHLCDGAAHTWPREDNDGPRPTRRDSLELVRVKGSCNGTDADEFREDSPAHCPSPPCEPSTTPLSSDILPSIPLRKRDMNKLSLTVTTNIPACSRFEFRPLEIEPRKRWRDRGRDVWERKPLRASQNPQPK